MTQYPMTAGQFDLVYNASSFTLASMMASTIFFWLRVSSIHEKYKSALVITGLVTFIAAYHYIRIFNSWVDAYSFPPAVDGVVQDPVQPPPHRPPVVGLLSPPPSPPSSTPLAPSPPQVVTGQPFNDAYRYMDWLLTVPLLLIEIVFVCNLSPAETSSKATSLGVASGLMIILGYPGEGMIDEDDLGTRWFFWAAAMCPFLYVVYTLLVGLNGAIASESNPAVREMLNGACYATVISWCTYPIVYVFPMIGFEGPGAVVAIQLGYCVADIVSKCGVGFLIYNVRASPTLATPAAFTPPLPRRSRSPSRRPRASSPARRAPATKVGSAPAVVSAKPSSGQSLADLTGKAVIASPIVPGSKGMY